jgi:hypothetical protein
MVQLSVYKKSTWIYEYFYILKYCLTLAFPLMLCVKGESANIDLIVVWHNRPSRLNPWSTALEVNIPTISYISQWNKIKLLKFA